MSNQFTLRSVLRRATLLLTIFSSMALAQTSTVTLSIVDSDGQPWNNGTWTVQLTSPPGIPSQRYAIAGTSTPVPNQQQAGNLDSNGNGSVTLTPSTSITPSGTQWTFVFCPQATPSSCTQLSYSIGASAPLTVQPPGVRVSVQNPTVRATAYTDTEIAGFNVGSQYFNLIDGTIHICTVLVQGLCTWVSIGNGGAGGLFTNFSASGLGTFSGSPGLIGFADDPNGCPFYMYAIAFVGTAITEQLCASNGLLQWTVNGQNGYTGTLIPCVLPSNGLPIPDGDYCSFSAADGAWELAQAGVAKQFCFSANVCYTSGAGVPSAGSCLAINGGSLYSRTDGDATHSLYVCDNSTHTWTPK